MCRGLGFLKRGFGFCGAVSRTRRTEVCVCGKGFVGRRFREEVEQRCVCVQEGFCAEEVECSVMSGEWWGRVCGQLWGSGGAVEEIVFRKQK